MGDLKSFVQAQNQQALKNAAEAPDWTKRKEKWLHELDAIMSRIRDELIEAGIQDDNATFVHHGVSEPGYPPYVAKGFKLYLPTGGFVTFQPIGSVIVGGYGRVDVEGPTGVRVKLIAVDKDDAVDRDKPSYERDWIWRVYPRPGTKEAFDFDDQALSKILELVTSN